MVHEHIIGMINDSDESYLVTVPALKEHIRLNIAMAELMNDPKVHFLLDAVYGGEYKVFSLADYCDGRCSTDLRRFRFCPVCGSAIDWRKIREGQKEG